MQSFPPRGPEPILVAPFARLPVLLLPMQGHYPLAGVPAWVIDERAEQCLLACAKLLLIPANPDRTAGR